jgi:hypothetical protein
MSWLGGELLGIFANQGKQDMSEHVDLGELVASAAPLEALRVGLEDALKEYGEHDLLVELLQNSLDAIDAIRYRAICAAAGRDHGALETVAQWNVAVEEAIENDYDAFAAASDPAARATWYGTARDDASRRRQWWELLAGKLGGTAGQLAHAASSHRGAVTVGIRTGSETWISVEDNGTGIEDVLKAFQLTYSDKRARPDMPRRHGVRGAHGWGLPAVLGLSDHVEVAARCGSTEQAYIFENFAPFARGTILVPEIRRVAFSEVAQHSQLMSGGDGTIVRTRISAPSDTNYLGYTLKNATADKLINLLRLYTPIAQVNDYLAHPAYHNSRAGDLDCTLRWTHDTATPIEKSVPFRFLELSELKNAPALDYKGYINSGMPGRRTVHTLYRGYRGGQYFLSAADIQPADIIRDLEADLEKDDALPGLIGDTGAPITEIPRGFQVAVSGGMRTEYRAREPKSTSAAFRGIVLQENQPPTLGRKYVVDQRRSLPKVAQDHEQTYEEVRKRVVGKAEPEPQTLASAMWRIQHFDRIRTGLRHQPPQSADLKNWAGNGSGEARVMLTFGELLGRGYFGELHILECGLQHAYDFSFIQFLKSGDIDTELRRALADAGYVIKVPASSNRYFRYGLGEFKNNGETVLGEFEQTRTQKQADTIDLLICHAFNEDAVAEYGWMSGEAEPGTIQFPGQTHTWQPATGYRYRSRALPVIALEHLIGAEVAAGHLAAFTEKWPDVLPPMFPTSSGFGN